MADFPGSWDDLLKQLVTALDAMYQHRNDAAYWTAQVESGVSPEGATRRDVTISAVSFEATGFDMTVQDGATQMTWHASPGHNGHPIQFNGAAHNEANVVLRYAGSPANPVRFHLDIRWVADAGTVYRLDSQFPKNS